MLEFARKVKYRPSNQQEGTGSYKSQINFRFFSVIWREKKISRKWNWASIFAGGKKRGDLRAKDELTGGRRSCPGTDLSFFNWAYFFGRQMYFFGRQTCFFFWLLGTWWVCELFKCAGGNMFLLFTHVNMQPVWKYFRLQGKSEKAHDNILASSKVYCLHLTFLLMCIFLHFRRPNLKEQYRVEKIETNLSTINLSFSDSPWTHKFWAHRTFLQFEFWNIFGRSLFKKTKTLEIKSELTSCLAKSYCPAVSRI